MSTIDECREKQRHRDVCFFHSSFGRTCSAFVFTNQHAYAVDTEFYSDLQHLGKIDWLLLQLRDFKTDDNDPGKQLRYQAEALIHRYVPLEAILGIACLNEVIKANLETLLKERGIVLTVRAKPTWYF